ncbi:hypothetical protein [Thioflexithrix psekupsensis]|uniref:ParB/Sulfiredoxin domain-containing protein n=1 Tax=Thioflexithrix psekupsensis TaxID=1570016 RepID=A0A251X9I8_9GAMM|nr:hypothetical protein [Thioflexithrix psekupsensis]OUD14397.1 hypothetical protein TPSD3_08790 [Thioflexithrix psekupsensis]
MYKYGDFIHFHLVDVPDIESDIPITDFDRQALEVLADKIVETGCLLKPLILKQISPMQLKVLVGHFEYHAAVLAKQRDKKRILSGMVSAFVVKKELEMQAIEQATLFQSTVTLQPALETPPISPNLPDHSSVNSVDLNQQIEQLTRTMHIMQETFSREMQAMQQEMRENARENAHYQQQLLQAIAALSVPISHSVATPVSPSSISTPTGVNAPMPAASYPSPDRLQKILDSLNNDAKSELIQKLKRVDWFKGKRAESFSEKFIELRQQLPFSSLSDVEKRVKGLGRETINKILQQFPL